MSNTGKGKTSITAAAWKGLVKDPNTVVTVMMVQFLARAAAIAPIAITALTNGKLPAWIALAGSAAVYIALVLPLRCWGGEKFRRMFYSRHMPDRNGNPYRKWLAADLFRYLHGLLWGLPFLGWLGYCIYYYITNKALQDTQGFNEMWKPVMNLATFLGQEPDMVLGLAVVFILLLILGAVFAYGWWRNVMLEYLPLRSVDLGRCFRWARRMRRRHRGELVKTTAVNILLNIPALAGFLLAMYFYLKEQIDFSKGSLYFFMKLPRVLFDLLDSLLAVRNPFSRQTLLILAAVGVLVYLPLCTFRKLRIAALAAKLMKGTPSSSEKHRRHSGVRESAVVLPKEETQEAFEPAQFPDQNAAG